MVDAFNQRPDPVTDLVISVEDLKAHYLFGVSLKDDNGNEMQDSLFEFYIKSATEWLQRELMIRILPTSVVNETHDYNYGDFLQYGRIQAHHRPVRSVSRYEITFPLADAKLTFDPKWFRANSLDGSINLIPTAGTISNIIVGMGGGYIPSLYGGVDYVPMVVSLDYEAGFPDGQIPADIIEVVGMHATLGPLHIAGDLLGGAGIAAKSISLDGLSESISTTSSPSFAGYGARVLNYNKQIAQKLAILRQNYAGIQFVVA